jgi:hypothetical protein
MDVRWFVVWVSSIALAGVTGCSSSDSKDGSTGDLGPAGGPIDAGAVAARCATANDGGPLVTTVDPAACMPDAGELPDGSEEEEEYPPTMFGAEGDDDDCKYHIAFTTTPVHRNTDVTFTVTATFKDGGAPVLMALPYIESYLDDTHPIPNAPTQTTEVGNGTYTIGPIRFDAAGDWTVRFHFNDQCTDSEESPHGHGAFFIRVP